MRGGGDSVHRRARDARPRAGGSDDDSAVRRLCHRPNTLQNLGNVYYNLADYAMALRCWEQALPLRRETGDGNGEAFTLSSIGVTYQSMGDAQKGLEYYASLFRAFVTSWLHFSR